jgi:hypothetical protein
MPAGKYHGLRTASPSSASNCRLGRDYDRAQFQLSKHLIRSLPKGSARCIKSVIAPSEKFARRGFPCSGHRNQCISADGSWFLAPGVTSKFAQIFFRDDKDLRGKRRRDLKNAYVTGIFSVSPESKNNAAFHRRKQIRTRDSTRLINTLGKIFLDSKAARRW